MSLKAIPSRADSREIREKVRKYFVANPFAKQRDCARDLGIGVMAVSRHCRALKAELGQPAVAAPEKSDLRRGFFMVPVGHFTKTTKSMSVSEKGSYMLLLAHMGQEGGRLPNDPHRLARLARMTIEEWGRFWSVAAPLFIVDGDHITHQYMGLEGDE